MADSTARQIGDMEVSYGGLFRKARDEIGASAFGLAVIELEPNADNHPDHDHADQEEVYVVLRGTAKRRIQPGDDGLRLLAIGGVPGQAYEAPGYSDVGAPDPLA